MSTPPMQITSEDSVHAWPRFESIRDPLDALVALSRYYGADPQFVLAGGGNTSVKVGQRLWLKASGTALAQADRDSFVEMDRSVLERLMEADFGSDRAQREQHCKHVLLAARITPDQGRRPSVECLLHHAMPGQFVVHTHSTIVNALTCCVRGRELAAEIFGDEVIWLPFVQPGLPLGQALYRALAEYRARTGRSGPTAVLMANHGLIVSGDDPDEIRRRTDGVVDKVRQRLGGGPGDTGDQPERRADVTAIVNSIGPLLRGLLADGPALKVVRFDDSDAVLRLMATPVGRAAALADPLTPDQIMYCNSFPLWLEAPADADAAKILSAAQAALKDYQAQYQCRPRIVLAPGVGMFAAGDDVTSTDAACAVCLDAVQVMCGAARLGGVSHLSQEQRRLIEGGEVQAYHHQAARAADGRGRVAGKVALVTGAAQGFGLEIAQAFAAEGGCVVLADLNHQGTRAAADSIVRAHGPGRAMGVAVNVTDPASVGACVHQAVRRYGGLDVLIANAGVLKAGSVKTQPIADFDFVTAVNYKGYFVCVQQAAPIMALQHRARPDYQSDIIQINSKSGLQGSNRNGAYAGSKFGGIGLTQSFALELVEDGIKVNAICPGNFFDGPLWNDPDRGLFVQYLRTGKVPGARTVADVRRFYEDKVPMRRGCTTPDVMKAVFYLMEQQYETGQAVPVTGGQVMLS